MFKFNQTIAQATTNYVDLILGTPTAGAVVKGVLNDKFDFSKIVQLQSSREISDEGSKAVRAAIRYAEWALIKKKLPIGDIADIGNGGLVSLISQELDKIERVGFSAKRDLPFIKSVKKLCLFSKDVDAIALHAKSVLVGNEGYITSEVGVLLGYLLRANSLTFNPETFQLDVVPTSERPSKGLEVWGLVKSLNLRLGKEFAKFTEMTNATRISQYEILGQDYKASKEAGSSAAWDKFLHDRDPNLSIITKIVRNILPPESLFKLEISREVVEGAVGITSEALPLKIEKNRDKK
jgi:hypothetical protein